MFISFEILILLIACYLIGSIPFGLLFSISISKNDPRLIGSKNIGATNITRISGWKVGLLTLLCDIFKGFLPVFIFKSQLVNIELMILCIFLGHVFLGKQKPLRGTLRRDIVAFLTQMDIT